jgi:dTDP-N-acetylfucosamine:lipid II N-acetylfucosaminyltransferase
MRPNLHIMHDVNQSNWYVEKCVYYAPENEDTFLGFGNPVKNLTHKRFVREPATPQAFDRWAEAINQGKYRQVIINYFDIHAAELVNRIKRKDVAIIWVLWGADLYTLPFFWNKLYDAFAANVLQVSRWNHMRKMYRLWKRRVRWGTKDHRYFYAAMRKTTHCATLVDHDVELVRKHLNPHVVQIPLSFSGLEDFASAKDLPKNSTIQIGNSGDPANNHIEMLQLLKSLNVSNQLFMPVPYGSRTYRDVLPSAVEALFSHEQLELQTTMISKEAYFERLASTGFAVMGHRRQQAFANIAALFYFGTKVFMREKNPLLKTFREWGLCVYSIEHDLNGKALELPLSEMDRTRNREIIIQRLNESAMKEYYRDLLLGPRFDYEK